MYAWILPEERIFITSKRLLLHMNNKNGHFRKLPGAISNAYTKNNKVTDIKNEVDDFGGL